MLSWCFVCHETDFFYKEKDFVYCFLKYLIISWFFMQLYFVYKLMLQKVIAYA